MTIRYLAARLAIVLVVFGMLIGSVSAQSPPIYFGKNSVNWQNEKPKWYQSEHFDVYYFGFDLADLEQERHFRNFIGNIESGYRQLRVTLKHNIERRIPVVVFSTHSKFEAGAAYVVGEFLSEGIGAFVESVHRRMYTKEDLLPVVRREANIHELVHEFQFDMLKINIFQRVVRQIQLPSGFFEGGAEFIASLYDPVPLDNIRKVHQRMAALNRRTIPTWTELINDRVNGYTMWMMVFQMLEDKYDAGVKLHVEGLQSGGAEGLGLLVYDLSKGELGNPAVNPEKFDQQARDYWYGIYGVDGNKKPRPYQETDSVRSRSVTPYENPYPMFLACQFPDGKRLAAFNIQKRMPALVSYPVPEEYLYSKKIELNDFKTDSKNIVEKNDNKSKKTIKNLTPQFPPVPWEYLIVQGFETWPFNGSDAGCSSDGKRITFFARTNRDHALYIIDAETGDIFRKVEFEKPLPQLDQAFSPVFSPDSKSIYFTAAYHITRDLYRVELESGIVTNLTNDSRFDTAPAVSPDGTRIAYIGQDGDFQHLFILDLSVGDKHQLTFGPFNDSSPSWSEDGARLVYASDVENNIWNLWTLDLETMISSQWTEFSGQVLVPMFVKGRPEKVYYTVYWDEDEYESNIYPNFEIYESTLKQPIIQRAFTDKGESTEYSFRPFRNLFNYELDKNQLANKLKPKEQWQLSGGDLYIGTSTFQGYGLFGTSFVEVNNMLQTKRHLFQFASYGSFLRLANYSYVNLENRWARIYNVSFQKTPMRYFYFDVVKRYAEQAVLNNTLINESSVGASFMYPSNKFNRWELYSKLRHRSYDLLGLDENTIRAINEINPGFFNDTELQMSRFLGSSGGTSFVLGGAYVRDTVTYSYDTKGPYHGNALRLQFEVAPPAGNALEGYASLGINARAYKGWTPGIMFAARIDVLENTRANGEFLLMGGPDMLRGVEYGSMVGNRIAYASAEIRFPLLDALVFPRGIAVGPFRGLLFADAGIARFSDEKFPSPKGTSIGTGVQFSPFSLIWRARKSNDKWIMDPTFYIRFDW